MNLRALCLFLLFLFSSLIAENVNNNLLFESLSVNQGLSSNRVTSILQDDKGFMWFGTGNGLNFYDGYSFLTYKNNQSDSSLIANNEIQDLLQDNDGNIWIATANGLTRLNRDATKARHFYARADDIRSISHNYIICLFLDSEDRLWVGTAWGLNRFEKETNTFVRYFFDEPSNENPDINRIWTLNEDSEHRLWIGTDAGIIIFDKSRNEWSMLRSGSNKSKSLISNAIRDIAFGPDSSVWIATENGLNRYLPAKNKFYVYRNDPLNEYSLSRDYIRTILLDSEQNLWVGTEWGLNKFSVPEQKFYSFFSDPKTPHSITENNITSIYEDKTGIIWIGTDGGGVNKYVPSKQQFHFTTIKSNQLPIDNNILALFVNDKNSIWASSHSGVYQWNPLENSFTLLHNIHKKEYTQQGSFLKAFYKDSAGAVWFGMMYGKHAGLYYYNPEKNRLKVINKNAPDSMALSNNNVTCIAADHKGNIWIGTDGGGVNRINPRTFAVTKFKSDDKSSTLLAGNWISSLLCDKNGDIWIGTDNGLSKYNLEKKYFENYQFHSDDSASIGSNQITTLFEDRNGALWIGMENGLSVMLGPASFKNYGRSDGLRQTSIRAIVEDDLGCLWLSTSSGITRFKVQDQSFRPYNRNDGLQVTEFNVGAAVKLASGAILFGGRKGLVWFDPAFLNRTAKVPTVVITTVSNYHNILLRGKELANLKDIKLSYKENFLEFQFAVLDYTNPLQNKYRYKLEGFDRDWRNPTRQRKAFYPNLPPGKYVFRVQGATGFSLWNKQGASLSINIIPPFWRKLWFRFLTLLCLIGVISLVFYVRHLQLEKRRQYLEKVVSERTKELATKNIELEKAKSAYQNLYDHAPVGYQELSEDGVIIQVNNTICSMLGYTKEEMIGRKIFDFIVPEQKDAAIQNFETIIASESEGNVEHPYIRKDGSKIILSIKYKVIYDDVLQLKLVRNALQDITAIRQLEEQLHQSQKMEAIGRLAGGIAHDFNNILTIIRGYCTILMRKTKDSPPLHNTIVRIDEAGERAEKLTRQLLAFSRRQQLQPLVLNLNDQLLNINEILARLVGEKIKIVLRLQEDLYNIKVDPDQFEHVIINLSANARDAMPEGGTLTFETRNVHIGKGDGDANSTLRPGDYAELLVSDSGDGIDMEDLEHIFEPFFTTKDKGKGTGLGLAMVYGFIKQSEGHINVKSIPGQGTTFELYFPKTTEELSQTDARDFDDVDVQGDETILVVEDEDHVRVLIGSTLQEQGYNVLISTEKKDELQRILKENKHIDLIVSDVIMPTRNGPEVVQCVQSRMPNIKVLFMSGYSDDHISSSGVLDEGVNFIQKPFTPQRLLVKIRSVLDG